MRNNVRLLLVMAVVLLLNACGGGSSATAPVPQFLIGISVDNAANPTKLYVTDYNLNVVQSVSSLTGTGATLTTIAGASGSSGATNANGTSAMFNGLEGVVVDSGGSLFVADANNEGIRKIALPASTATVTTFAGTLGTTGATDATGTAALFNMPRGMGIDSADNLYVADAFNHTIRKITSAGVVTTLAGLAGTMGSTDGTGSAARFRFPFAVATDNTNLYVSDSFNNAIRKIVISTGVVTTLAGNTSSFGYVDATGTSAKFNFPLGIATDGTYIYVSDAGNNVIRKIDSSGVVTTLAGSATGTAGNANGTGTAAAFNTPVGLAYGNGKLYVIDQNGTHIRIVDTTSAAVTTLY
jgi:hypothetical protein